MIRGGRAVLSVGSGDDEAVVTMRHIMPAKSHVIVVMDAAEGIIDKAFIRINLGWEWGLLACSTAEPSRPRSGAAEV